ncbi:ABC transporter substrate-binding protein [Antribacter gilvus]|uniref:ABC transporter substrate-binding protein n=1 Tax=Antribacter gilvus TaxID=2304675 RepID=UPI0013DF678D|nr:ABC transporter substrate-binding protein [Antribacter gilvus]
MRHAKSIAVAAAAAALTFTLTACGSEAPVLEPSASPSPEAAGAEGELTPITVGVLPIIDVAPLYLGVEEGVFEAHGLEVEIVKAESGPAIVPAVASGEYEFGFSNVTSLLLAQAGGEELQIVAPGNYTTEDPAADFGNTVVPAGSAIAGAADLAGKKVAVNAPKSLLQATIMSEVEKAGGDPESVTFVPMPFGDMPAALAGGDVDAAMVMEPFLTLSKEQGATPLDISFASNQAELLVAGYFATDEYAAENPEVVEAFIAALTESFELASDEATAREALGLYTTLEPAVRDAITLPVWKAELDDTSVELQAELAQKFNFSEGAELDAAGLLP